MSIEFATFTEDEQAAVDAIINRAASLYRAAGIKQTLTHIRMDLSAFHAKCPLRLHDLLDADDANFSHDIGGIYRHLNRETGELEDCFRPRFSAPAQAA